MYICRCFSNELQKVGSNYFNANVLYYRDTCIELRPILLFVTIFVLGQCSENHPIASKPTEENK